MKKRVFFILLCLCLGITFSVTAQENVTYSDELRQKAEQGNAEAQHNLGECYAYGEGVAQDEVKARYWYKKAFEQYKQQAKQGSAEVQTRLGDCYYLGEGVKKSDKKAKYWWKKALEQYKQKAKQGNAEAQYDLGGKYYENEEYEKAVEWYTKSAQQGNADAQNELGFCYQFEKGVEQDYKKAFDWYAKAANQGYAEAQYNLGTCYELGQGVEQDYSQAVEWYAKAANQGYAEAQYNLGTCYFSGQGVEKDYSQARYWYNKALNNPDASEDIKNFAQSELEDLDRVMILQQQAEQGDVNAQINLGTCYANGKGVPRDYAQARYWFNKALNNPDASEDIKSYAGEELIDIDRVMILRQQAEEGDAEAQYFLGDCYENGKGVEQDYIQARFLYNIVLTNPDANEDTKSLARKRLEALDELDK